MHKLEFKMLLLSITLLCNSFVLSYAQEDKDQIPRKVDSYNDKIRGSEAEQWHLEDFLTVLVKEPNSKAFIIAYGGREDYPGKALRYAERARNYLVTARGIDPA